MDRNKRKLLYLFPAFGFMKLAIAQSTPFNEDCKEEKEIEIIIDKTKCISCTLCVDVCPIGVLEMVDRGDNEKDAAPSYPKEVFGMSCIACRRCETVCVTEPLAISIKDNRW